MRTLILGVAVMLISGLAADLALIQPADLAAQLAASGTHPPVLLYVGPNVLYRARHIPGSVYAGPAGRPEGLELLKHTLEGIPRDREVILYCGCCPWGNCPNVKPSMALVKQMGFTRVKALYLESNFATDWTAKGYPAEPGAPKQ
jgi:thiosulfate/3-mercaptopyruvate sulfurtransferase